MIKHCIALAARKGGVGKTTVACGLASVLSSQQHRTLVIDLDPQSNSAYVLGVDPTKPGTAALLVGNNTPSPLAVSEMLSVLPGGPELTSHTIQNLHPEDLADATQSLDYEVLVLDCPPGNEHLERLALVAATTVLVVADAHPLAVIGAGRVINDLEASKRKGRRGAKRWAIVQSRLDLRRSLDRALEEQLKQAYPKTPRLVVHQDTNLSLAAADRTPITFYAPDCRGVSDLSTIAKWVLDG